MHVLVTGFDPFGGELVNPAQLIVEQLSDVIGEHRISTRIIPTKAFDALACIEQALDELNPDAVICLGQAGGISHIALERVGINVCEFRISDNAGNQLVGVPVKEDGPDAYLVSLPLKSMCSEIRKEGIPAALSYSAGTFVCNYVLYGTNWLLAQRNKAGRAGFIHLPYAPVQVLDKPHQPSMSTDMMLRGVTAALCAIDKQDIDTQSVEGELY